MRLFRSRPRVDVAGLPKNIAAQLVQLADDVDTAPCDLRRRRAYSDFLRGLGRFDAATSHYQALAGAYAAQGSLFRAIAVCKTILELDAAHVETEATLARMYAQHDVQSGHALTVELPASMGEALLVDHNELLDSAVANAMPARPMSLDYMTPVSDEREAIGADDIADTVDIEIDADSGDEIVDGDILAGLVVKAEGSITLDRPAAVPLFSGLAPESFTELVKALRCWQAEAGAVIVVEGEPGDSVFVIARGAVVIERAGDTGPVELARMKAGDFFGEIAILAERPRAASVMALKKTELLEIDRTALAALVIRDPRAGDVLEAFCTRRLIENTLLTSPLFVGLDTDALGRTIDRFESCVVGDGDYLLTQGKEVGGLHILLSGVVDVMASSDVDGLTTTMRLKRLGPGDVFGEMGLLRRQPATASCVAVGPARLAVLGDKTFDELQSEHPDLRARLENLTDARAAFNARFLPSNDISGARPAAL